jgi:hypothetical protein
MNPGGNFTNSAFQGWGFQSTTENLVRIMMTRSATIQRMFASVNVAVGAGNTRTFTARKNGVNQTLTCTITNAATTASDTTNSFTAVAGDFISVIQTAVGAVASGGSVSVEIAT